MTNTIDPITAPPILPAANYVLVVLRDLATSSLLLPDNSAAYPYCLAIATGSACTWVKPGDKLFCPMPQNLQAVPIPDDKENYAIVCETSITAKYNL